MSQLYTIQTEASSSAPVRKGRPLLAWCVILAVIAFILWRSAKVSPREQERYDLVTMRLQGRYLLGLSEIFSTHKSIRDQLYPEARRSLNRGTYAKRLRFVVLSGELEGPDEARQQLRQINREYREHCGEPPAEEAETAQLLDHLYGIRAGDLDLDLTFPGANNAQKLRQRLDWFGELALAPPDGEDAAAREAVLTPAYRTAWGFLAIAAFMLLAGLTGLVFLVLLFVLFFLNRLKSGLAPASPRHGIYAETFALYMVLYLGLSFAARYVIRWFALEQSSLVFSGLVALASLTALVWPVLRGIPWRQVRQDIGWHFDRVPGLELLFGPGCYALALPMLFFGIVLYLILTKLRDRLGFGPDEFGPSNAPGHPIVFWVGQAGWWVWLEIVFVASVAAPIVEETMFRGVLYRHLRSASSRWRPAWSVLFSALVVSFLFAVIHPQGFLAVPMLMALALAFTLMREWRGTLLPPMIAHGINNAVATLLLFLMS